MKTPHCLKAQACMILLYIFIYFKYQSIPVGIGESKVNYRTNCYAWLFKLCPHVCV